MLRCPSLTHRIASRRLTDMLMNPSDYAVDYLRKTLEPCVFQVLKKNGKMEVCGKCTDSSTCCQIFKTDTMGRGVRAAKNLPKGTRIGCYMGVLRNSKDVIEFRDWRYDYAYGLKNYYVDASDCKSMMAILNHSCYDNVGTRYVLHECYDGMIECHIEFFTIRDIHVGEELFIDYGPDYWKYAKTRGLVQYELCDDSFGCDMDIVNPDLSIYYNSDDDMDIENDDYEEHTRKIERKYFEYLNSIMGDEQKKITDYYTPMKIAT